MTEKKEAAPKAATRKESLASDEVTKKTTPELREEADGSTFVKNYLVNTDDSSKIDNVVHERNKKDVVASALQRGLLATADPELTESKIVDEHNAELTYTVAVKLNK